jgi:hypothetical protein
MGKLATFNPSANDCQILNKKGKSSLKWYICDAHSLVDVKL